MRARLACLLSLLTHNVDRYLIFKSFIYFGNKQYDQKIKTFFPYAILKPFQSVVPSPSLSTKHCTILCGFFLSVLTRHRQNTDCRTWSILKTSAGCQKLRQRSLLSKHELKPKALTSSYILIHRGGRVLDTLCQHVRDI